MPDFIKVGAGRNIGYGLLFFIIIAVACGLGGFIAIVASSEENFAIGLFGSIMIIASGPILALIIGIIQGKLAKNSGEALIAGGVTGTVGYILLLFIVLGFIMAGVAIKFPTEGEGDGDVDVDINLGPMVAQWIAIFLPSGIIGALSAFFSMKYIFATYPAHFPALEEPIYQQGYASTQQQYSSVYQQQSPYTQQPYQQTTQPEEQFTILDCPHCGRPFKAQMPDKPCRGKCPSCGGSVIIGL